MHDIVVCDSRLVLSLVGLSRSVLFRRRNGSDPLPSSGLSGHLTSVDSLLSTSQGRCDTLNLGIHEWAIGVDLRR